MPFRHTFSQNFISIVNLTLKAYREHKNKKSKLFYSNIPRKVFLVWKFLKKKLILSFKFYKIWFFVILCPLQMSTTDVHYRCPLQVSTTDHLPYAGCYKIYCSIQGSCEQPSSLKTGAKGREEATPLPPPPPLRNILASLYFLRGGDFRNKETLEDWFRYWNKLIYL